MNVAIVVDSMPYPADGGSRIRTLSLMTRLARKHRITAICRAGLDERQTRQAVEYLADHCIQSIMVDDAPRPRSGARFYAGLGANLFSDKPYSIASHDSPAVRAAVRELAAREAIDLWQIEWLAYADSLRHLPAARILLMSHNVESLIWQRYVQVERRTHVRWYLRNQWHKFQRLESRLVAGATHVVAVSENDASLLSGQFGARQVSVVENGVDTALFAAASGQRDPNRILFLGSLDWRPNVDAIGALLDRIFPKVLQSCPMARLSIVGRNPSARLRTKIASMPGVELHADVPDVRPFLATSGILAVPLRIGAGSRLKILEALACALPVVSSTVGCEGLTLLPGHDLVVADGDDAMAAELIKSIREPDAAARMGQQGQESVRAKYDWDLLAGRLEQIWLQMGGRVPSAEISGSN